MNAERFNELENRASDIGQLDAVAQLETRARVKKEIQSLIDEGGAYTLSNEEEEMIRSLRRFKLRMTKSSGTFRWQTRRPDGVQIVEETAMIVHPSEELA